MADIMIMWHGSLQWGRRQVKEWHFLTDMYVESLKILANHPKVHLTVQFGGQDVEWMLHERPEFIRQVREMLDTGQIEVAMGGYSHNFQGCVPEGTHANLALAQAFCKKAFGVIASGYWPAESMLNRGMPAALLETGFSYTACDNLNFRNAAEMELSITGKIFRLRGAHGKSILGLPVSRFADCNRRGEKAGILNFAQNPSRYDFKSEIVLNRCNRTSLVVEIGDWEHFNLHQKKVQEVHMGTFEIGDRRNRIDPEKLEAWDRILRELQKAGHRFITGRETLARHKPSGSVELVDGRDYTKNDLTRLVDACGWHHSNSKDLSGRKDPHRLSDEESYSHSFAGAKAWQHLHDLGGDERMESHTKDMLISFCSAHRSGGEEFTVKQQLLDRVNRVVEAFQIRRERVLGEEEILLPSGIPKGSWPIALRLNKAPAGYEILSDGKKIGSGWVEKSPQKVASFERTHLFWITGPIPPGHYTLKTVSRVKISNEIKITREETSLTLQSKDGFLRIDTLHGGNLGAWTVKGFSPFVSLGRLELASTWQDAPLCNEVSAKTTWRRVPDGVHVDCHLTVGNVPIRRSWWVSSDLRCCRLRTLFHHRQFQYLAPCSYHLNSQAFGRKGRFVMIAEGHTQIASEPLMEFHNMHHLGSELLGFSGKRGLLGLSTNRLTSSPILRRHPLSGTFVLMDSRPIGAADEAHPYEFAEDPVLEIIFRLEPAPFKNKTFASWQSFQNHPPIPGAGLSTLLKVEPDWSKNIPHISQVNPHF